MNKYKRLTIKVGTSTLTHKTGLLNYRSMEKLVQVVADLKNAGFEIVMVSSGSIGVGAGKLGFRSMPKDIPTKQACASIGQSELMYVYDRLFGEYNHIISQILLTRYSVDKQEKRHNVCNTFNRLFEMGVIPIVNENDTVSTDELEFGDNDTLSAIVAGMVQADLLIILTDIDGLYTDNPLENKMAKRIPLVHKIDDTVRKAAQGKGSAFGTGGMITKIDAAQIAAQKGIETAILDGKKPQDMYKLLNGEEVGTRFLLD